jgi:3-hydroxyacyl-CoA dehydrogenase
VRLQVNADVAATAYELATKLRSMPVRVRVRDGFIANCTLTV